MAIGQREKAGFLALQKLLDHRFCPGFAKATGKNVGHGGFGFGHGHGDGDAFARCQPIGLDHHRRAKAGEGGHGAGMIGNPFIPARGNLRAGAEVLGEALRAFQLRRQLAGAEHGHTRTAQRIGQAVNQRCFGADDHQPDALRLAKGQHGGMIGHIQRGQLGVLRYPRIARRGMEFCARLR